METAKQENITKVSSGLEDIARGIESLSSVELSPGSARMLLFGMGLGVMFGSAKVVQGELITPQDIESGAALVKTVVAMAAPLATSVELQRNITKRTTIPLSSHVGPWIGKGLRALADVIKE